MVMRHQLQMILRSEYLNQLRKLHDSSFLEERCTILNSHYMVEEDALILQAAVPPSVLETFSLAYIEFKITYTPIYQEPFLLMRLWRKYSMQESKDDFDDDMITLWFPADVKQALGIMQDFQVGLDAISSTSEKTQEAWYSFHPCDTAQIVGDQELYRGNYLERWLSVFLFSWYGL